MERNRSDYLGTMCGRDYYDYDGIREVWYENGNKRIEFGYKNGKRHGCSTSWYENGTKKQVVNFIDGIRGGEFELYYEDGKLSAKGVFANDKPNNVTMYNRDGVTINDEKYWMSLSNNNHY